MEVNEDIVYRNLAQRIFLGVREQNFQDWEGRGAVLPEAPRCLL